MAGDSFKRLVGDEAEGQGWGSFDFAAGLVGVDVSCIGEGEVAVEGDADADGGGESELGWAGKGLAGKG